MKRLIAILVFCITILPVVNLSSNIYANEPEITHPSVTTTEDLAPLEEVYGELKFPAVTRVLYRGAKLFCNMANPKNLSKGCTPPGWVMVVGSVPMAFTATTASINKALKVDAKAIKGIFIRTKQSA